MTPQPIQIQPLLPAAGISPASAARSDTDNSEFSGLMGNHLASLEQPSEVNAVPAELEIMAAADGTDLPHMEILADEPGPLAEDADPVDALSQHIESALEDAGEVGAETAVQPVAKQEVSLELAEELQLPWQQALTMERPEQSRGLGPALAPGHLKQLDDAASIDDSGPVVGETVPELLDADGTQSIVQSMDLLKPAEPIRADDNKVQDNQNPIPFLASVKGQPEVTQLVAEARPEQFDPSAPARALFARAQGNSELVASSAPAAQTSSQANTILPQATATNTGSEGFDDLMQQGFSHMRDQAGDRLPQQVGDEGVKGFSHMLNQVDARPIATTAAATLETASTLMQQAKPLDIPVGGRGWDQGVGERIQWMLGRGVQQAEIKLNPQHLGPLEIRVSMLNDQANVTILAQQSMTREAVEASLPRLREMMQEINVNLGSVDVGRRETAHQQGQGTGRNGSDSSNGAFGGQDDEISEDLMNAPARRETSSLVDDFA